MDTEDLDRNPALAAFADHIADLARAAADAHADTLGGIPQIQIICVLDDDMETVGLRVDPMTMADAMTDICANWAAEGEIDLAELEGNGRGRGAGPRPN